MAPNENDIVYIFVASAGVVEQCKVVAKDFGHTNQYLLHGMDSKAGFVADIGDMFRSAEECLKETTKRRGQEYLMYYDNFDSIEAILLRALHAGKTGKAFEPLELLALTNRASELLGTDVAEALDEYAEATEKENKESEKRKKD